MIAANLSLSDPAGTSALLAPVQWFEGTMLGSLATTIAVISVGSVGFMALTGRIPVKRAMTVVLGCFVLFGAPRIAAGIRGASDFAIEPRAVAAAQNAPSPLAQMPSQPPRPAYDPYAGAGIPQR